MQSFLPKQNIAKAIGKLCVKVVIRSKLQKDDPDHWV